MHENLICKICGEDIGNRRYMIKEYMSGTLEEYEYLECQNCKSLILKDIPKDMAKFYSNEEYYSFGSINRIINWVKVHYVNSFFKKDFLGSIFKKFIDDNIQFYELLSDLMKSKKLDYNSKILDIGCGNGTFIRELYNCGFKNVFGLEPFLNEEFDDGQIKIYKNFIEDFNSDDKFDLIFFKDSLEHMENPFQSLKKVKDLLNDEGYMIISIPVKTDYFWNLYGTFWFQLDAPRHFVTFSLDGFKIMAKHLDLEIEEIIFNSNPYSIVISEDYAEGRSMYSKDSFSSRNYFKNMWNKRFKKLDLKILNKKTRFVDLEPFIEELNKNQSSEHAIFLLKKK